MSERNRTPEEIRAEHLGQVDARAYWTYLLVVLVAGTAAMIGFIALLDALG